VDIVPKKSARQVKKPSKREGSALGETTGPVERMKEGALGRKTQSKRGGAENGLGKKKSSGLGGGKSKSWKSVGKTSGQREPRKRHEGC